MQRNFIFKPQRNNFHESTFGLGMTFPNSHINVLNSDAKLRNTLWIKNYEWKARGNIPCTISFHFHFVIVHLYVFPCVSLFVAWCDAGETHFIIHKLSFSLPQSERLPCDDGSRFRTTPQKNCFAIPVRYENRNNKTSLKKFY